MVVWNVICIYCDTMFEHVKLNGHGWPGFRELFDVIKICDAKLKDNCCQLCSLVYSQSGQVIYAYYKEDLDAVRGVELH